MAVVQALISHDRGPMPTWRVELHTDGWLRIYHHGALALDRASIEQVREHLEANGVDIERDLEPS